MPDRFAMPHRACFLIVINVGDAKKCIIWPNPDGIENNGAKS